MMPHPAVKISQFRNARSS